MGFQAEVVTFNDGSSKMELTRDDFPHRPILTVGGLSTEDLEWLADQINVGHPLTATFRSLLIGGIGIITGVLLTFFISG